MSTLLTRPEFRDAIRRDLQIVPPIDSGTGLAGEEPPQAPWPDNPTLNQVLQQAITDVNRACNFHVSVVNVPITAVETGTLGPLGVPMSTLNAGPMLGIGNVNDIRRVLWTDSLSSVPVLLQGSFRDSLDRSYVSNYYAQPAAVPGMWYVEGYNLWITPAPVDNGVLNVVCGTGVIGLQGENDPIDQIPTDYQWVVEYQAIVRLSKINALDIEGQARAQNLIPDAERGMRELKAWVEGLSGSVQPALGFRSYRSGYGTRRVVR